MRYIRLAVVGTFLILSCTHGVSHAQTAPASDPAELLFWESIRNSTNPADFQEYLKQYPNGRFAGLARNRLKAEGTAPASPQAAPSSALPRPGASFRDCDVCPEMVTIPAGSFTMGSPESEAGRGSDEDPQHTVTIPRSFAAGKYEVTFDEWDACVRESGCSQNPSDHGWGRGRRPVIHVSWNNAKEYVAWLSRKTGKTYRLLTDAEWEYVARAGTTTAFSWGNSITPQLANYNAAYSYARSPRGTPERKTVEVGRYAPNAFGLYDMHGNVWELVEDCWNRSYAGAPSDGSAWTSGNCAQRVLRGGAWFNHPQDLRSASRSGSDPTHRDGGAGLRVARTN